MKALIQTLSESGDKPSKEQIDAAIDLASKAFAKSKSVAQKPNGHPTVDARKSTVDRILVSVPWIEKSYGDHDEERGHLAYYEVVKGKATEID